MRTSWLIALAALTFATSCGENGETVFLYFIDAYPGAENVSIIGDSGPLVNGAKFGERHGRDGTCRPGGRARDCVPIEYDRKIGGDFQMIVQNMPQVASFSLNLQNMYPQETGTVLFNRRTSESAVDVQLFRHIQSASSTCTLTMVNGLSLGNSDLTANSQFSIIPEFRIDNFDRVDYRDEAVLPIPTECGFLPIDDPQHDQLARGNLLDRIAVSPWFILVECTEESDPATNICYNWGPTFQDDRSFIGLQGEVLTERSTTEYYECLQSTFTFNTEGMAMGGIPGEESCPTAPLTWSDVSIDVLAAAECRDPRLVRPTSIDPSARLALIETGGVCEYTMRPRTAAQDVIFEGSHGVENGELIVSEIDIDPGSEHFWVIFGRPVNPILWQWDSGNQIADLREFPYFNGQDSRIGDY